MQTQNQTSDGLGQQRYQRQLSRRASHPKHRQPRVRLGKPTPHDSYVHWQDYLDIADRHKLPVPVHVDRTTRDIEKAHPSLTYEVLRRYSESMTQFGREFSEALHGAPTLQTEIATIRPETH